MLGGKSNNLKEIQNLLQLKKKQNQRGKDYGKIKIRHHLGNLEKKIKNNINGGLSLLNLEIERLIGKFSKEIDEKLKKYDFTIKDITFDKKDDEVLKIKITKK